MVLAGGRSRRFGHDKAVHPVDGRAMALRVADAMLAGGVARVVAVGGDAPALHALGLETEPDRWPEAGPVGGLLTALAGAVAADPDVIVVVVACDLPDLDGPAVAAVLAPVRDGRAAVAVAVDPAGRRQPLLGAWRGGEVLAPLAAAFAAGERSMQGALAALDAAGVTVVEIAVAADALRNVNHPDDLAR